ncbi:MAG: hypothetical protein QOG04_2185 [Actinomycetota bacterium]|nr:hypothetical protein [Actinomycetota bacterium]
MKKFLFCCVAFLLGIAPAGADTVRTQDDVAHDASSASMDIKWVGHGHAGKKLAHVISTYEAWRSSDLGNGVLQINIAPGADGGEGVTRIIVIYLDGTKLVSKMYDVAHSGSRVVGHPDVSRSTARSVKVTFPKRFIRWKVKAYRWDALYAEQRTEDTVPSDDSRILHRL